MMFWGVLAAVTLAGGLFLMLLFRESGVGFTGRIALSFLIGLGAYSYILYLVMAIGVPLIPATPAVLAGLLVVVPLLILLFRGRLFSSSAGFKWLPISDILTFIGVLPLLVLNVYVAWKTPIYWPDSIFYYDGIGKVIAEDTQIRFAFLGNNLFFYGMTSLALQLLHATGYALGNDRQALLYPLYFSALILLLHESFMREVRSRMTMGFAERLVAIAMLFVAATTPFVFAMGFIVLNSLPAAVYLFAGVMAWLEYRVTTQRAWAILSGLLLGLASWTRYDAVLFSVPILLACAYISYRKRSHFGGLLWATGLQAAIIAGKYIPILFSGSLSVVLGDSGVPLLDLGAALLLFGLAGVVKGWKYEPLMARRIAWLMPAGVAVIVFIILALRGGAVLGSAMRLTKLMADPIWGLSWLSLFLVPLCLFSSGEKWRLLVFAVGSLLVLRVLLYVDWAIGFLPSDQSITHSGNRVLLYIWPFALNGAAAGILTVLRRLQGQSAARS